MPVTANDFFCHMDSFVDYRRTVYEVSERTIESNRIDLKLFKDFIERRKDNTIDGPAIIDFQYYLKQERGNEGGSINRKIFTLRRYAKHLRLIDVAEAESLPFDDVLKIRQGYRKRPLALTDQQIKRLFAAVDRRTVLGIRDYAVYSLMFLAGLRVGEVHWLDLGNIDFDRRLLNVLGKGDKPRTLDINDELLGILTDYLAVRQTIHGHDLSPVLFVSKKGNRLAIRTMEDNLTKIRAKADLGASFPVTCHTLRHTFASHLNDKGVDILVIQSLLGHGTPRSTEGYIHPSQEKIRQAMAKLPAIAFLQELINNGVLNLSFQGHRRKRE
ncbi:MAG: tyrosine-type recombinase/integrase [Proteobacteria bacterium]|nr:tyrosine-type recombinase/integrase [Pseudomonadota bacterium]